PVRCLLGGGFPRANGKWSPWCLPVHHDRIILSSTVARAVHAAAHRPHQGASGSDRPHPPNLPNILCRISRHLRRGWISSRAALLPLSSPRELLTGADFGRPSGSSAPPPAPPPPSGRKRALVSSGQEGVWVRRPNPRSR